MKTSIETGSTIAIPDDHDGVQSKVDVDTTVGLEPVDMKFVYLEMLRELRKMNTKLSMILDLIISEKAG